MDSIFTFIDWFIKAIYEHDKLSHLWTWLMWSEEKIRQSNLVEMMIRQLVMLEKIRQSNLVEMMIRQLVMLEKIRQSNLVEMMIRQLVMLINDCLKVSHTHPHSNDNLFEIIPHVKLCNNQLGYLY